MPMPSLDASGKSAEMTRYPRHAPKRIPHTGVAGETLTVRTRPVACSIALSDANLSGRIVAVSHSV